MKVNIIEQVSSLLTQVSKKFHNVAVKRRALFFMICISKDQNSLFLHPIKTNKL